MLYKSMKFDLKELKEDGTFEGLAASYGNVDLGLDIIEPGAFTKTLKEKNGIITLLAHHNARAPIGKGELKDTKKGLWINGKLVLKSPTAAETYELMKEDVLKGLSIGYDTIVSEYDSENDIRRLKELRLWEVSIVTFPMNERATIQSVKTIADQTIDGLGQMIVRERKAGREIPEAIMKEIKEFIALVDKRAAQPNNTGPSIHSAVEKANSLSDLLNKGFNVLGS